MKSAKTHQMKKHIPNFLTTLNLLFGIFAMIAAFNHHLEWTAIFISFSLVFDFSDGLTARLLNARSEFGKQLDSLADMVSFGLVPGVIIYFLLLNSQSLPEIILFQINTIPFLGFLIPVFSALRLAKFNIDPRQEEKFFGLPTPANTIFIVSIALINVNIFNDSTYFSELTNQAWFLLFIIFLSCFLLIAKIPLLAFKFKSMSWGGNKAQFIIVLISVILIFFLKIVAVPIILLVYILVSVFFREKV